MEVTEIVDDGYYNVTRDKAGAYTTNTNPTWGKGATVVNYGKSGDGGVLMTASESNAPYLSVFDHAGSPWTTINTRVRIGNLNGYLGYNTDVYGIGVGTSTQYLKYDSANGLRIAGAITASTINIGTNGFHCDINGNIWWGEYPTYASAVIKISSAGVVALTSGTIGGFTLGADYIKDVADSTGIASTVTAGDDVRFWAGATFANRATAPFRVTEAGALVATNALITIATLGGFTVGADYIVDAGNSFGLSSTITAGDDVRFWAGSTFANRATAPIRITEAGVMTATGVVITGTLTAGAGSTVSVAYLGAGTISSKAILMAVAAGTGDSYIAGGNNLDLTNWVGGDANGGAWILGQDDSDSDRAKLFIGNYSTSRYLSYDGLSTLTLSGCVIDVASSTYRMRFEPDYPMVKWSYVKANGYGYYDLSYISSYAGSISDNGAGGVTVTNPGITFWGSKGARVYLYSEDDSTCRLIAAAGNTLRIGSATSKVTIFSNGLSSCPLPTSDSALAKIRTISEPKEKSQLLHPDKAHFEQKDKRKKKTKYFDIDDMPDECRYINPDGEDDIEIIRTVGFLVKAVKELTEENDILKDKINKISK